MTQQYPLCIPAQQALLPGRDKPASHQQPPLDDRPRTDVTLADIPVIFEDDTLLVVDKPAGLLTVPGRGDYQHLIGTLLQHTEPLFVVHRLDMATSGLVVLAKNPKAQKDLSLAFASRAVSKRYVALVSGRVRDEGPQSISLPLIIDWPNRPRSKVDFEVGKPALTHWSVMAQESLGTAPVTRMALEPHTGRTHQLRVHMQAIGHPIVGDRLYAPLPVAHASDRLLLHAEQLTLVHPSSGQTLTLLAPVPF